MSKKIACVGLSGGVDSSLSAWLLQSRNYEVHGVFMKNWRDDFSSHHSYCTQNEDLNDAISVCEFLDIPLEVVDFSKEYYEKVFSHFLSEYQQGRTPNPDVFCNAYIKFDCFLRYAQAQGADCIATGHYVRMEQCDDGTYQLLKGVDLSKDQSYFLYRLNQEQLSYAVFPLGGFHKTTVRRLARQIGLPNADKRDSTGICFIGERPFREFLSHFVSAQPGPIYTIDGQYLGDHQGLMFHTIGQRKGLGVGGVRGFSTQQAWYVVSKDVKKNALIVCLGRDHPALYRDSIDLCDLSWVGEPPTESVPYFSQIRYHQPDQLCFYHPLSERVAHTSFIVPQRAVASGQSVVFYNGNVCLGGGIVFSDEEN